jgi:hypothetical protein
MGQSCAGSYGSYVLLGSGFKHATAKANLYRAPNVG